MLSGNLPTIIERSEGRNASSAVSQHNSCCPSQINSSPIDWLDLRMDDLQRPQQAISIWLAEVFALLSDLE